MNDKENFIREVDTHLYKLLDAYRSLLRKSQQIESQQELHFKAITSQIVSVLAYLSLSLELLSQFFHNNTGVLFSIVIGEDQ